MKIKKNVLIGIAAAWLLLPGAGRVYGGLVLVNVQGKVEYRASPEKAWEPAAAGAAVREGGSVKTGRLSWTELRYEDNSTVALGPDTEFVLYDAKPDNRFSKLLAGFYRAVVKRTDRKFSVRTPAAVATVHGTRFTLAALRNGTTRTRVFSGIVGVADTKGTETEVKPDELLTVDREGAGQVVPSPAASLPGGWTLDAPAGFAYGRSGWTMKTPSEAGFSFKGRPVTLDHFERLTREDRVINWKKGRAWPAECPGKAEPRELRANLLDGRPMFSYACPAQDLSKPEWQHRYFEVPVEKENGLAVSAMRLHYAHYVQPGLPAAAELGRLYGARGGRDNAAAYTRDVMKLAAQGASAGSLDGPGLGAVVNSVLTLYQEGWGADKESYTGKVVPLIE